ncbi:hypothetical protein [Campylobacter sp. MG1]|uniref:hypothetical protein n=1 Tax=Campylobacter sp. MG1 TaxID=2976332 RepID=UPI00226D227D|nr:hypothetical protein [Campylobacter sp. MG1]
MLKKSLICYIFIGLNLSANNIDVNAIMKSITENKDINSFKVENLKKEVIGSNEKGKEIQGIYQGAGEELLLKVQLNYNNNGLNLNIKNNKNTTLATLNNIKGVCSGNVNYDDNYNETGKYLNELIFAKDYKVIERQINKTRLEAIQKKCGEFRSWGFNKSIFNNYKQVNECYKRECEIFNKDINVAKEKKYFWFFSGGKGICYEKLGVYSGYTLQVNNANSVSIINTISDLSTNGCYCTSKDCDSPLGREDIARIIEQGLLGKISQSIFITNTSYKNDEILFYALKSDKVNNINTARNFTDFSMPTISKNASNKTISNEVEKVKEKDEAYKQIKTSTISNNYLADENSFEFKELNSITNMNEKVIKDNAKIKDDILEYNTQNNKKEVIEVTKVQKPKSLGKCLIGFKQKSNTIIQDDILKTENKKNDDYTHLKTKACIEDSNKKAICPLENKEIIVKDCNENIDNVSLAKTYAANELIKELKEVRKGSNKEYIPNDIRIFKAQRHNILEKQIYSCPASNLGNIRMSGFHPSILAEYVAMMATQATQCLIKPMFYSFFSGGILNLVDSEYAKYVEFDVGFAQNHQKTCCHAKFKEQKIEFPEVLEFKTSDEAKAFCDSKKSYLKSAYNSTCAEYINSAKATTRVTNVAGSGCNIAYAYDGEKAFKVDRTSKLGSLDAKISTGYNLSNLKLASARLNTCKSDLSEQEGFVQKVADGSCRFINHTRRIDYYSKTRKSGPFGAIRGTISFPRYTEHIYNFCCQNSRFARIIMENAERQAKTNPKLKGVNFCDGLTLEQFKLLDFNDMNFDEVLADFGISASANLSDVSTEDLSKYISVINNTLIKENIDKREAYKTNENK